MKMIIQDVNHKLFVHFINHTNVLMVNVLVILNSVKHSIHAHKVKLIVEMDSVLLNKYALNHHIALLLHQFYVQMENVFNLFLNALLLIQLYVILIDQLDVFLDTVSHMLANVLKNLLEYST